MNLYKNASNQMRHKQIQVVGFLFAEIACPNGGQVGNRKRSALYSFSPTNFAAKKYVMIWHLNIEHIVRHTHERERKI